MYTKKGDLERARSNIDAAVSAHEKSIADFQEARRLDPKNRQIGFNLKQAEVNKESAKTSTTIHGKDMKAIFLIADIYRRGEAYAEKGDYDRAISEYNQVLEIDPKYFDALNARGIAYTNKRNYNKAIADFDSLTKMNPSDPRAYLGRGHIYFRNDDNEKAIANYNKAIEIDGQGKYVNNVIAVEQQQQQQRLGGRSIVLDRLFEAYTNRGTAYYNRGNYGKAVSDYEMALSISPGHSGVLQMLERARQHD